MLEHVNIPLRADVADVLRKLVAGELSPELASNWASGWLSHSDNIDDLKEPNKTCQEIATRPICARSDGVLLETIKVLRAIGAIGGANLPSTAHQYLYGRMDFEKWLNELMR